jgi:hypothetical protein
MAFLRRHARTLGLLLAGLALSALTYDPPF